MTSFQWRLCAAFSCRPVGVITAPNDIVIDFNDGDVSDVRLEQHS